VAEIAFSALADRARCVTFRIELPRSDWMGATKFAIN
jgi:hypothetical protein